MILLNLFCVIAAVVAFVPTGSNGNSNNTIFTKSNGIFAARFYNTMRSGRSNRGNFIISPLSLNYALTALSLGANGNTLRQLRRALGLPNNRNLISSSYNYFTNFIQNNRKTSIATELFIDNRIRIKKDFQQHLENNFNAGVMNLNFREDPEGATQEINRVFDVKTHHLIPHIFPRGLIDPTIVSVLVNTIYFQASWLEKFSKTATQKQKFFGSNTISEVDMMFQENYFYYKEDDLLQAQVLAILYEGSQYSFNILLPYAKEGLPTVENALQERVRKNPYSSPYVDVFNGFSLENVKLHLPKLKLEGKFGLRHQLLQLGIVDMICRNKNEYKANFVNLSDHPLCVNEVIQDIFINVDEDGTNVSYATEAEVPYSHLRRQTDGLPKIFNVDHPFLFLIEYIPTKTAILKGRVNDL